MTVTTPIDQFGNRMRDTERESPGILASVFSALSVGFDRSVGRRFYRFHRFIYRATAGVIGHRTPAGPMLLLTTIGRKSGQERVTPLLYMTDGPRFVVVGSNGGRPQPPAWLLNLSATPEVEVQAGHRKISAEAHVLTDEERLDMWPRLFQHYQGWSHYQRLTERELNVVSLVPAA